MKQYLILYSLLVASIALCNSCKKDSKEDSKTKTYREDFIDSFYDLQSRGWVLKDNSTPYSAGWWQGFTVDKSGRAGFEAYSYKTQKSEYAHVGYMPWGTDPINISSWMISPIYEINNGDQLVFYTRAADGTGSVNRLQVRLNETDNTPDAGNTASSIGK